MKNQNNTDYNPQLVNYLFNSLKDVPELKWKDRNDDNIVCSASTQFGEFTIKSHLGGPGSYILYLNDKFASSYADNVFDLMDLANHLYLQKMKKQLTRIYNLEYTI